MFRVQVRGDGINEKHCYNVLDNGAVVDITRQQYGDIAVSFSSAPVQLNSRYKNIRDKVLSDDETRLQYDILKERVARWLYFAV